MKVAVFGAWYSGRSGFECTGTLSEFSSAGRAIGRLLCYLEHQLIITSYTEQTLDCFVAQGFLEALAEVGHTATGAELTIVLYGSEQADRQYPETSDEGFNELAARYGKYISFITAPGRLRFSRHFAAIGECEAVIVLGGADHTFLAGRVARVARKLVIPLGCFGGAARDLLEEGLRPPHHEEVPSIPPESQLRRLFAPWNEDVKSVVKAILSETPIALVHGRSSDWQALRTLLQTSLSRETRQFRPLLMRELELDSETLPYKWERVGSVASAAIALVTPDDSGGVHGSADLVPRARQNVWLEVGWMWGRLGRSRVLLLVKGDVEVPSDLQGVEYLRYETEVAECRDRIAAFLARVSR